LPGSGMANPVAAPSISASTNNPVSCGATNGSITITGSGTGTLIWSGTTSGNMPAVSLPQTVNGLGAGSYTFLFDNGCPSNTLNLSLSDPSAPSAPVVTVTDGCGSSILFATGSNLLWSTGETTSS